jgi:hypothetical protein
VQKQILPWRAGRACGGVGAKGEAYLDRGICFARPLTIIFSLR